MAMMQAVMWMSCTCVDWRAYSPCLMFSNYSFIVLLLKLELNAPKRVQTMLGLWRDILWFCFEFSGEMVAAQYVYATVTALTATDDGRVIIASKLGSLIVNQLFGATSAQSSSHTERKTGQISPAVTRNLTRQRVISATSSRRNRMQSSACSIL